MKSFWINKTNKKQVQVMVRHGLAIPLTQLFMYWLMFESKARSKAKTP